MFTHKIRYSRSLNRWVIDLFINSKPISQTADFIEIEFFLPLIYITNLNNEIIIKFEFVFPRDNSKLVYLDQIETIISYISNTIGNYWKIRFLYTANMYHLCTVCIYFKPYKNILIQLL